MLAWGVNASPGAMFSPSRSAIPVCVVRHDLHQPARAHPGNGFGIEAALLAHHCPDQQRVHVEFGGCGRHGVGIGPWVAQAPEFERRPLVVSDIPLGDCLRIDHVPAGAQSFRQPPGPPRAHGGRARPAPVPGAPGPPGRSPPAPPPGPACLWLPRPRPTRPPGTPRGPGGAGTGERRRGRQAELARRWRRQRWHAIVGTDSQPIRPRPSNNALPWASACRSPVRLAQDG